MLGVERLSQLEFLAMLPRHGLLADETLRQFKLKRAAGAYVYSLGKKTEAWAVRYADTGGELPLDGTVVEDGKMFSPYAWCHTWDEATIERMRTECVFGLGGGELGGEAWGGYAYWFEGVPDYARGDFPWEEDCPDCTGGVHDMGGKELGCPTCDGRARIDAKYRTCIYYMTAKEDLHGGAWRLVATFRSSGERECWFDGPGCDDYLVTDREARETRRTAGLAVPQDEENRCPLCEDSGSIYLGDGWGEAVYRSTVP